MRLEAGVVGAGVATAERLLGQKAASPVAEPELLVQGELKGSEPGGADGEPGQAETHPEPVFPGRGGRGRKGGGREGGGAGAGRGDYNSTASTSWGTLGR